jgi:hypothetical protein
MLVGRGVILLGGPIATTNGDSNRSVQRIHMTGQTVSVGGGAFVGG